MLLKAEEKIGREIDIPFYPTLLSSQGGRSQQPTILLIKKPLAVFANSEQKLRTVVTRFEKSALASCTRNACLAVELADHIDKPIGYLRCQIGPLHIHRDRNKICLDVEPSADRLPELLDCSFHSCRRVFLIHTDNLEQRGAVKRIFGARIREPCLGEPGQ